ncbi:unnamed protein product [Musa textilis]
MYNAHCHLLFLQLAMEFLEGVATVQLQSCHETYLVVDEDSHRVTLRSDRFSDGAWWTVVITNVDGQQRLRLKSFYGRYLAPHPTDASVIYGRKVFLDNLGLDVNWEPVREGIDVRLKCHFDQFLRADSDSLRWCESGTVPGRSEDSDRAFCGASNASGWLLLLHHHWRSCLLLLHHHRAVAASASCM